MKKLLVLMLVASLTALANGLPIITTDLQISVNGNPDPIDSEIFLRPSETAMLDVVAPAGWVYPGYTIYWALLVAPADGTIVGGVAKINPAPDASMMLDPDGWLGNWPLDGRWGVCGSIDSWGAVTAPGGVYFDEILFHCESLNYNTVIQLVATPGDFVNFEVLDQVVIHQPEPATIALLSLGGLLLRKRK